MSLQEQRASVAGCYLLGRTFERRIKILLWKYQIVKLEGSPGSSLLKGLSWFHTTASWISRSLFFPTHSHRALSFFILMQSEGRLHIKLGAFIHCEPGSTGSRCPQSSAFIQLMIRPLTSAAKATALLRAGPLKDFISKKTTQVMWRVNLTIMKGSTNKCRLLIKTACSEKLQWSEGMGDRLKRKPVDHEIPNLYTWETVGDCISGTEKQQNQHKGVSVCDTIISSCVTKLYNPMLPCFLRGISYHVPYRIIRDFIFYLIWICLFWTRVSLHLSRDRSKSCFRRLLQQAGRIPLLLLHFRGNAWSREQPGGEISQEFIGSDTKGAD